MEPILAIIAGLIGASITGLIACRYRAQLDYNDEVRGPRRAAPVVPRSVQLRLRGE